MHNSVFFEELETGDEPLTANEQRILRVVVEGLSITMKRADNPDAQLERLVAIIESALPDLRVWIQDARQPRRPPEE